MVISSWLKEATWQKALTPTFQQPYFKKLSDFVLKNYDEHPCYPPIQDVFQTFEYCPFAEIKVVILGQDPYHQKGQAHGLAFSVNNEIPHPPSLRNIFKELQIDIGCPYPIHGNLTSWATQGVLLLNTTLTVQESSPTSHQKQGWETFTDEVIKLLVTRNEPIVFMLWGGYAKAKQKLIYNPKHYVLTSGHPSPLSANRGLWFGNRHFSQANSYLTTNGKKAIDWALT